MTLGPVLSSLGCLAEAAVQSSSASFTRCEDILNHSLFFESLLKAHFETPSGTITVQSLQEKYTEAEIKNITRILEWHFLLVYGHTLDGSAESADEPTKIKAMLGISNWVELILPSKGGQLDSTFTLLETPVDGQISAYRTFLNEAKEQFEDNSKPEVTADIMCAIFPHLDCTAASLQLSMLTKNCQRGWAYFISILMNFEEQKDFLDQLLFDATNSTSHDELKNFMTTLVERLTSPEKELKPLPQLDIPGFPKWVKNGDNTCYIDATLLPLSRCLATPQLLEVDLNELTVDKICDIRRTMQKLCPEKFSKPTECEQEDAGCFLSGIFETVLDHAKCAKKLVLAHSFVDQDATLERDETEYDYKNALSARYDPHNALLLDVPFQEASTLTSLVSARKSHGIINRQVERKEGVEVADKYRYIKAEHTEQYMAQSYELAPDFICIRLLRFSQAGLKRTEQIPPDQLLQFACTSGEPPVQYALVGATIHEGNSIQSGHYYSILTDETGKYVLYDDFKGQFLIEEEEAMQRMATSYIIYYKKTPLV